MPDGIVRAVDRANSSSTIDTTPGSVNAPDFGFERAVPRGGYAWWYIDALSSDERFGITLIAMLGSVFSPYYFQARQYEPTNPLDHSALNVALYGACGHRWSLTERRCGTVRRSATALTIGPNRIAWHGGALHVAIDELTAPWRTRIRGAVRIKPTAIATASYALDHDRQHHWRPIAPTCAVEVALDAPALSWRGRGYLDCNWGAAPLDAAFQGWQWSRLAAGEDTLVTYDVARRAGDSYQLALAFGPDAMPRPFEAPAPVALPNSRWQVARQLRADATSTPSVRATLEDTPFYSRSMVATQLLGRPALGMHESLSLARFERPWVQRLLPVRMRRA